MHFMDNLVRSFKQGGEVIAELIPIIYDTAREIQILGEDEAVKIIKINEEHTDEKGKPIHYDMTRGKYEPIVTSGKAFDSKRMETFDTMQQLVQSAPNLLPMFGDVLFQASDLAGADILSERFKKMLPPNLQDNDDQEIPPQAQAAIQQLQQHTQALNAACKEYESQIHKLEFEKAAKIVDNNAKLELHRLDVEADIAKAEITTKAQSSQEREAFVRDVAMQVMSMSHERAMAAQQAGHQQDLQQQQAETQSQQSAQDAAQSQEVSASCRSPVIPPDATSRPMPTSLETSR
jgi:hypothetical protein